MSLAALIEKLEQATVAQAQELSQEVAKAVGTYSLTAERFPTYPPYCESLDAALSLVEAGKDWGMTIVHGDGKLAEAAVYHVPFYSFNDDDRAGREIATAHTPALALCIAALKARGEA